MMADESRSKECGRSGVWAWVVSVVLGVCLSVALVYTLAGRGTTQILHVPSFAPHGHNKFYLHSRVKPVENQHNERFNITAAFIGRLGNCLFEFASLLGIAEHNRMKVVMTNVQTLTSIFSLKKRPSVDLLQEGKRYVSFGERFGWGRWDNGTLTLALQQHNIILRGYFQSYLYFENIKTALHEELTFLPHVQSKGRSLVEQQYPGIWKNKNVKKIGVHIRRGDFTLSANQAIGRTVANKTYFQKAMKFMKDRFHNVIFIVASDDLQWAKSNLGSTSVVYSSGLSPGADLALLASCDHMIISSGSFSWWAAWLANGTTIYYELFPKPQSGLAAGFSRHEYYPPHWIPMK